jgi:hypothetical protein
MSVTTLDATPPPGVPTSTVTTVALFRAHFPEFASTTTYPDVVVQMFIDTGSVLVRPERWHSLTAFGVELFTAHMLALQQMAMQGGRGGGVPGQARGLQTNKSVSKVSVGYDYSMVGMEGWGIFNLTMYGQQFAFYAELFGTGGFEVLGIGYEPQLAGVVWTWTNGVMMRWGS